MKLLNTMCLFLLVVTAQYSAAQQRTLDHISNTYLSPSNELKAVDFVNRTLNLIYNKFEGETTLFRRKK